ncbi:hypothetical protein L1987_48041 [Smallanthus sonchifolius]|uniref:Uncharacterized protein n=1 Tax=Smallanthus sonchifolius TaxID=185202 RepID=A0ACB9FRC4_9ASTR|nr:hypothetical protein L1987_48041 [Smallanthus sonchifolius]
MTQNFKPSVESFALLLRILIKNQFLNAAEKIRILMVKACATDEDARFHGYNLQPTELGHYSGRGTSISRFSTFVALEEPITPHAKVEYTKLLINGQFVDGASGKTFPTLDTRTGQLIANVAEGDTEDANRSVSAARKAFDESPWPRMTAYVSLFFGSFFILKLGKMGSCMNRDEILLFIRLFHYYAGWADNIHGLIIQAYNSCLRASSC